MTERNFYRVGVLFLYLSLGVLFMLSTLLDLYIWLTSLPFILTYAIYFIRSSKQPNSTAGLYSGPLYFSAISMAYTTLGASIINITQENSSPWMIFYLGLLGAALGLIVGYVIIFLLRVTALIVFSGYFRKPLTRR